MREDILAADDTVSLWVQESNTSLHLRLDFNVSSLIKLYLLLSGATFINSNNAYVIIVTLRANVSVFTGARGDELKLQKRYLKR